MEFSGYRLLLADRQVRTIFVAAFFARIPMMALPLVLTLLVTEGMGGSYKQAGLVATCETLGAAIGAPWRGRRIDRTGLRRAIVPSIVVTALVVPALGLVPTYLALLPLAFLAGLFLIPIHTIVRLALTAQVSESQRRTAFAADSTMAEASFIIGPAVGGFLAAFYSPSVALVGIGCCVVLAGVMFWVLDPDLRSGPGRPGAAVATDPAGPETLHDVRGWITPKVVLLLVISAASMVALMGTDLGIIAELREQDEIALVGVVYGTWGLASLVGGLLYGAWSHSIRPSYLLLALGLFTLPAVFAQNVWSLALLVIPAGALCAPTLTASSEWLTRLVPPDRLGEAMGWQGTAFTTGGALGAPLAGAAMDAQGAWAGFAVGGAVATVVALGAMGLVVWQTRRSPASTPI
ncbi:MFS transporter [Aeromicrobium massiliense]|uniref:MFS transporter n=1 Tax=Aeromicrobium massiliense TaxID=1464554 RepID=UPI0005782004|nr:MFS transporter [Aeromicrobium massiliense]